MCNNVNKTKTVSYQDFSYQLICRPKLKIRCIGSAIPYLFNFLTQKNILIMNIKEKRSCFTIADKKYQLKLALSIGIITYTEYKKRMCLINN